MAKHREIILLMNCPLFTGRNLRSQNSQDLRHLVPCCLGSFPYTGYFQRAAPAEAPPLLPLLCWSFSLERLVDASGCLLATPPSLCTSPPWEQRVAETVGGGLSRRQPILISRACSSDFFSPGEVFPGPGSSSRLCSLCERLVPASLPMLHANFKTPFFKAFFFSLFPAHLRQVPG